jgi:hypothetical protein
MRLLWRSSGISGAMMLFNTFRLAKSRPYGRPAILPVLSNGSLKYSHDPIAGLPGVRDKYGSLFL